MLNEDNHELNYCEIVKGYNVSPNPISKSR